MILAMYLNPSFLLCLTENQHGSTFSWICYIQTFQTFPKVICGPENIIVSQCSLIHLLVFSLSLWPLSGRAVILLINSINLLIHHSWNSPSLASWTPTNSLIFQSLHFCVPDFTNFSEGLSLISLTCSSYYMSLATSPSSGSPMICMLMTKSTLQHQS